MVDRKSGATSLLVAHLFDQRATAIELTVPADPANWASRPTVREHPVTAVEEISPAYFRVSIADAETTSGGEDDAFASNLAAPAH